MKNYVSKAKEIATSCAANLNLYIKKVEFVCESGVYILRIIADKKDGIFDIDDCTKLNEAISAELDKADFIEEEYMLEVSSPGAEEELESEEEIKDNINSYIHIDFNKPIEIMKGINIHDIEGTLIEVNEDNIVLSINLKGRIKKQTIAKENIKLIRKAIKF